MPAPPRSAHWCWCGGYVVRDSVRCADYLIRLGGASAWVDSLLFFALPSDFRGRIGTNAIR